MQKYIASKKNVGLLLDRLRRLYSQPTQSIHGFDISKVKNNRNWHLREPLKRLPATVTLHPWFKYPDDAPRFYHENKRKPLIHIRFHSFSAFTVDTSDVLYFLGNRVLIKSTWVYTDSHKYMLKEVRPINLTPQELDELDAAYESEISNNDMLYQDEDSDEFEYWSDY